MTIRLKQNENIAALKTITQRECERTNNLQRFYICLLAIAVCYFYLHGLYWRHSLPTLLLTYVATIKIFSFQVLTTLLILMEAANRRKQHAQFLLVLEEIEVALKLRLRLDVRKCELIKTLNYLIISFVTLSLLGLALFIITSMWLNYIFFFWSSLWAIVTIRLRVIQLCLYVRTLQHYLEWLCAKLPQIVAYHLAPQQQLLDIDYGQLGSVAYLLCIKEIYALISKTFHLLNYFCGWSLFGIFICYILDIICNIYWILLSLDGYPNRNIII
ncbi:putative gustatory receptor 39b [Eurosta solidaginis]|uniref:putative gustatory receptor 39b n=1 Tax=Eurosta solidaginis TaxID=178769 RepID=UPI0035307BE4